MNYPFFAFMARLKYISRWGLMRNSISENDAEHTLQTVMIAHALAVIGRDIFHKNLNPERAALLALYHDASEVFTGDMPTPVKYFTSTFGSSTRKSKIRPGKNCSVPCLKVCGLPTSPTWWTWKRIPSGPWPRRRIP